MKHLEVPELPSEKRHDLPHDVDRLPRDARAGEGSRRPLSERRGDGRRPRPRRARPRRVARDGGVGDTDSLGGGYGRDGDRGDDDCAAVASRCCCAARRPAGARLLRPRRAAAQASAMAVGRRAAVRPRCGTRRLVPIRPDLEQDLVQRAGRRRVLHQPHAVGSRGQDPRDRADAGGEDRAKPDDRAGPRLSAGSDRGREDPEGQPGHDLHLDREAEGCGTAARRAAGDRCSVGAQGAAS